MNTENRQTTSMVLAGLLLLGAVLIYFELITPAYSALQQLKGQDESEKQLADNETQVVAEVKQLILTYQNQTSSNQEVNMALPVGADLSGAIAQVFGLALDSQITVESAALSQQAAPPVPVSTAGVTAGGVTDVATRGSITKPTATLSLAISGYGSYEALKAFLHGLETNIRIFDVSSITITPTNTTPTKGPIVIPDLFTYTISVITYYQAP